MELDIDYLQKLHLDPWSDLREKILVFVVDQMLDGMHPFDLIVFLDQTSYLLQLILLALFYQIVFLHPVKFVQTQKK